MTRKEKLWVIWDGKELLWSGDGKEYLRGVGLRYLLHPAFEEGYKKILDRYKPKKKYKLLLILPCSYGKPYSQSYIHYFLLKTIRETGYYEHIHQLIVTNAGVVPRELDEYYPYLAYDWNPQYETPEIKEEYVKVLVKRLKGYLEKFKGYYENIAAYLRWNSDSYRAVKIVEKELGIRIPNLAAKNVPEKELQQVSLNGLYVDDDLVLITPTSLDMLKQGIIKIIEGEKPY